MSLELGEQKGTWQSVRLLVPSFRQYGLRLGLGVLSLLAVDFLQLFIPRLIKAAVDELERGKASQAGLLRYAGFILLLALGIAFFRFGWRYLILGYSRLLERDLRNQLFSHLLSLDRIFYQRRTTGELMSLSSNDLSAVQLACGMGFVAMVDAVVMTIASILFMIYIHPGLTLIAVIPMPVLALFTRKLSGRLHHRFKKVQEQFSELTEYARTSLASIRLIKAYTQEKSQTGRFASLGEVYIKDNLRVARVEGLLSPISGTSANISMLLVLFFGGRLTILGVITTGDFVAFLAYLFLLTWPMMAIGWVANLFQRGITSLARIQAVLEERPALKDCPHTLPPPPALEGITISELTFTYPGQKQAALTNITLEIRPGLLGVVGRTGSGKSTLCYLLARLYPVPDAMIFYAGQDINRLSLATVRGHIAYVPQDVFLFSDTIRANIALGNPRASQTQIENAARIAAIHEEIIAMAEGYETRVGERGINLSGGQRQRLALARALLLDRQIVIIDDGLSAVDTETEQTIIRRLAAYLKGRICLIVSHRVAPLADADRIIVLELGRIVAQGGHEELLKSSPFYAFIHAHQTSATSIITNKCVGDA